MLSETKDGKEESELDILITTAETATEMKPRRKGKKSKKTGHET